MRIYEYICLFERINKNFDCSLVEFILMFDVNRENNLYTNKPKNIYG